MKILVVAGARPNFMKIAPLTRVLNQRNQIDQRNQINFKVVHTGQHYDYEMSQVFFGDLEISKPEYFLGVGSESHAVQTARIMIAFEEVCLKEKPDAIVVVGDVNSTVACALVAKKLGIGVAHVEAGLRSRDLTMPEEINRMVTDTLSDWLFVSEKSGIDNLRKEGKSESSIHFVGNVMIDTLYHNLRRIGDLSTYQRITGNYAVLTLHRPSNVDLEEKLKELMGAVGEIAKDFPVYFPVHPRTRERMDSAGLAARFNGGPVHLLPPLSYKPFLALYKDASLVLTDSGGLQEETTALGIPCFTIRENTERPVTIEEGTNTLVGTTAEGILAAFERFKKGEAKKGRIPELWDGHASERIVDILLRKIG
ncbi:MAG: UDP-N-acetylglucosamine 2-epimerase (non-hydrolyzing) [Deltaproteobacteria bacterium]|nr:UDP-N-acetylglucosamine 2-epimerase (non-hydrolyzing) [Deltaproteobacteria bacterium]